MTEGQIAVVEKLISSFKHDLYELKMPDPKGDGVKIINSPEALLAEWREMKRLRDETVCDFCAQPSDELFVTCHKCYARD